MRRGLIAAGTVIGLIAVGTGGVVAYRAFTGDDGPAPAVALPADTVGYLSIDLDPSLSQKVDAVALLDKFPAFAQQVSIGSGDDVREKIFDAARDEAGGSCASLSFDDDVKPWLGNQFAFAAVPTPGDSGSDADSSAGSGVSPVGVIAITDAEKAKAGIEKLKACDGSDSSDGSDGSGDSGGYAVEGDDWLVVADSDQTAQAVADEASSGNLADDADYGRWTDAVGDAGIINGYAAPSAKTYLAQAFSDLSGVAGEGVGTTVTTDGGYTSYGQTAPSSPPPGQQALDQLFAGFDGAALAVRFDGDSAEVELAGGGSALNSAASDQGAEVVKTLPDDTAAAFGVGLQAGWFTQLTDYFSSVSGGTLDLDSQLQELEQATGLDFPADAETLLGSSAAVAVGSGITSEGLAQGQAPIAVKVKGDPSAISQVLAKIGSSQPLDAQEQQVLQVATNGDYATVGLDPTYRDQVSAGGDLGSSSTFTDVVAHADDAGSILYVNFDQDDWLANLAGNFDDGSGDAEQVRANLEPLKALGLSSWSDGGVSHTVLRITTD